MASIYDELSKTQGIIIIIFILKKKVGGQKRAKVENRRIKTSLFRCVQHDFQTIADPFSKNHYTDKATSNARSQVGREEEFLTTRKID